MITFSLTAVKIGNAGMVGNVPRMERASAVMDSLEEPVVLDQVKVSLLAIPMTASFLY